METDILELSTQVNDEFTLISLFFRADLVVKLVILMLFAASIFSWAIIIQKIKLFKKIKELSDNFDSIFWSGKSIKEIQKELADEEDFPVKNVFEEAVKDNPKLKFKDFLSSRRQKLNDGGVTGDSLAEDYGDLIDSWVRKIDLASPSESLTEYINRIRKSESKSE